MNLKSLFDLRATNNWILALSILANLTWSFFALLTAYYAAGTGIASLELIQIALMLAEFIGPFAIAWFCGWLAFDDRGTTYGLIGALGSVFIILFALLLTGAIAILLSFAALAGGFNGGIITQYRGGRKKE